MPDEGAIILLCLCICILTVLGTVIFLITIYLIRKRRSTTLSGQAATAVPNAKPNALQLQGVVRGFKESRQSVPRFNNQDLDLIVWSFQLERHSETEERVDPIPVEMRGKFFSGTINEGNIVRLYEKSWDGGIVRTQRVYNVTFKEDIKAHVETIASGAMKTVASIFKKKNAKNAKSNDLHLQGVVRGFKESKQSKPGFNNMLEDIVWTFQLERHSETQERLDPVPVEMRGRYFSGFINEGNIVRLYEKSWQGGIVRTKRVYNVTFKEDIKAHG